MPALDLPRSVTGTGVDGVWPIHGPMHIIDTFDESLTNLCRSSRAGVPAGCARPPIRPTPVAGMRHRRPLGNNPAPSVHCPGIGRGPEQRWIPAGAAMTVVRYFNDGLRAVVPLATTCGRKADRAWRRPPRWSAPGGLPGRVCVRSDPCNPMACPSAVASPS